MADPAVIQSVETAWICAVNGIPDGEAADLLPSSLLCVSSPFAAQWEEEVTSSQPAGHDSEENFWFREADFTFL